MFLDYYGLREQPFGVTPDPRYLYFASSHREALSSLLLSYESGLGFATLIAQPGLGKTTLLHSFLSRIKSSTRCAYMFETQCDSRELLRHVLCDLGTDPPETDMNLMFRTFRDVAVRTAQTGCRLLLIIDEAQNLSVPALETVRLLSNFEAPTTKLVHIVLAGQPQLAEVLNRPELAQLRQRISTAAKLDPLSRSAVREYVAHRLKTAGYRGHSLFTSDALDLIAQQSGGIPRQINRICFNALSLCYAQNRNSIDAALIRDPATSPDNAMLPEPEAGRSIRQEPAPSGTEANEAAAGLPGPNFSGQSGPDTCADLGSTRSAESVSGASATQGRGSGVSAGFEAYGAAPVSATYVRAGQQSQPGPNSRSPDERVSRALYANDAAAKAWRSDPLHSRPRRVPARRRHGGAIAAILVGASFLALLLAVARHGEVSSTAPEPKRSSPAEKVSPMAARPSTAAASTNEENVPALGSTRAEGAEKASGQGGRAAWNASPFPLQGATVRGEGVPIRAIAVPPNPSAAETGWVQPPAVVTQQNRFPVITPATPQTPALLADGTSHSEPVRASEPAPGTLLTRIEPEYPATAREAQITGSVVLSVRVGTDGRVTQVRTIRGNSVLARAAVDAVRRWVYVPFTMNGRKIEKDATIVVRFNP